MLSALPACFYRETGIVNYWDTFGTFFNTIFYHVNAESGMLTANKAIFEPQKVASEKNTNLSVTVDWVYYNAKKF